jgi:hypothetical protein
MTTILGKNERTNVNQKRNDAKMLSLSTVSIVQGNIETPRWETHTPLWNLSQRPYF